MSQGPLCPNLTKKGQAEVSQMANLNLSRMILLGGLSVNLNHLKIAVLPFVLIKKLGRGTNQLGRSFCTFSAKFL